MPDKKTALMMAAGTGGHVFPALAVARELADQGYDIHWLGTPHGMENRLVGGAGFTLHPVSIKGLRGKGALGLLMAPLRVLQATLQSLAIIRRIKPGVVAGFGGYIAGPGGVAARLMGIPLLIHEQNALAGMTNRLLNRVATVSLQAFPGALPGAAVVGNPVRADIIHCSSERQASKRLRVLVVGGSLGAAALNRVVLDVWKSLPVEQRPALKHQVGKRDFTAMTEAYTRSGLLNDPKADVGVQEFIQDMSAAYQWADLVICRSGALTVSEIAVSGKPAIFVPYPHAVDDHQAVNASYLENAGAALICQQHDLTAEWLKETIAALTSGPEQLKYMAECSRRCAVLDATERTVEEIERIYRDR